jgi:chaperone required for assembly of F1-ATPase
VTLDGRPVRIPGGPELLLPSKALAEAAAAEWQEVADEVSYAALPLTRIAGTGQHRIAPDPAPTAREIARYGTSDLLCYRAPDPPALIERQAALWQPWLDWAAATYGARLRVTAGIVHIRQDEAALSALAQAVAAQPPLALAALGVAVPALGSLVLGLAMAEGAVTAATAHSLACLDELFQEELWGVDQEALERRNHVAAEIAAAGRVLTLLRT